MHLCPFATNWPKAVRWNVPFYCYRQIIVSREDVGKGMEALAPPRKACSSNLLEIALHNEVLNVGSAHHEPLSLPKVDRPQLRLYNTAVAHDAHEHVEIPRRMRDRRGDIELRRKVATKVHDGRVILAQEIDLVRRQACAQVGVREERRERTAERPVRVLEAVEAVRVVGEQAAFVAQDGGLVKEERGGVAREGGVGGLRGDGAVDEVLEVALLADDGAHEHIVVL